LLRAQPRDCRLAIGYCRLERALRRGSGQGNWLRVTRRGLRVGMRIEERGPRCSILDARCSILGRGEERGVRSGWGKLDPGSSFLDPRSSILNPGCSMLGRSEVRGSWSEWGDRTLDPGSSILDPRNFRSSGATSGIAGGRQVRSTAWNALGVTAGCSLFIVGVQRVGQFNHLDIAEGDSVRLD
jgi:hypothetical protein